MYKLKCSKLGINAFKIMRKFYCPKRSKAIVSNSLPTLKNFTLHRKEPISSHHLNRLLSIQRRSFHVNNPEQQQQTPRTPDLIYFPHVLRWLRTKIRFKYLKQTWDPSFSEGAFIYGSTQAVCRVTEIIHNNKPEELNNLVTSYTKTKLIDDMRSKLTQMQKQIIHITPKDIKILVPMSVEMSTNGAEKKCKIAMRVLALKWFPQKNGVMRLVLVALQSEFMKDYTHNTNGDWTISGFDIMECTVLTETPAQNV